MEKNKAQVCYFSKLGTVLLFPNQEREVKAVSVYNAERIQAGMYLVEDGDGMKYIYLPLFSEDVYVGWTKQIPRPAKRLQISGFFASQLEQEVKTGKKPEEAMIKLSITEVLAKYEDNLFICRNELDKIIVVVME